MELTSSACWIDRRPPPRSHHANRCNTVGIFSCAVSRVACGIVLVLGGFEVMTECDPGMMRGLFMISRFVMLGGLAMMSGGLIIVLRCLFVMLVNLVLCHSDLPDFPVSARLHTRQALNRALIFLRQCARIR
jgi:hypothetical protein